MKVLFLTPEQAAVTAGVSPRTVYRWVEAGKVHFLDAVDGETLICVNSLPEASRPVT